jgi:NAD(P)-dependent dehydrogenase (short-subunit alcohol dehydrogenase family)
MNPAVDPESGKIAVVFGGTSGIGLATARVLVESGARVAIVGRDAAKGERATRELGDLAHYLQADVAQAGEVAGVIDEITRRWGRLDWAVNAAALAELRRVRTADITLEEWQRTLSADLTGVWLALKYEITAMLRTGGGSIVNVSSINGMSATPLAAAYCVSKHGIHGLSKTAALEYAADRIRINVVCPGAHLTPMLRTVFDMVSPGAPDQAEAMYRSLIPVGRIGDPIECAQSIAWLLSDAASYVTGAVLTVDGGLSLKIA